MISLNVSLAIIHTASSSSSLVSRLRQFHFPATAYNRSFPRKFQQKKKMKNVQHVSTGWRGGGGGSGGVLVFNMYNFYSTDLSCKGYKDKCRNLLPRRCIRKLGEELCLDNKRFRHLEV